MPSRKTLAPNQDTKIQSGSPLSYICFLLLGTLIILLTSCGGSELNRKEQKTLFSLYPVLEEELVNLTEEVMNEERLKKFPAVKKVYQIDGEDFAFVVKPIGYNGPISILLTIGTKKEESSYLRIVKHLETKHYVRDMESPWFVERFQDKSVYLNLITVKLEAMADNEIVAITGSTVTTEAVVNGVNAAFAVFREYVFQEDLPAVPLEVEGFVRGS